MATAATLVFRMAIDGPLGGRPTLVIFTLPIVLSAYLGGMRAGVLATALSYLGASYYVLPPIHSVAVASPVDRWQQFSLVLAGVYISVSSEALRRARGRAAIAVREHQRAEEANVRALERLREAQRIGRMGDWDFDLATGAIAWSPQTFEILGRDPSLGPPQSYEENAAMYGAESAALMAEKVAAAIASGEAQEYEIVAIRPDGQRVPVQAMAVPRKDGTGKVVGLNGTVQDLSARKQAERLIRESEERLRVAVEAAELGTWDLDLTTNMAVRSLREYEIWGYRELQPEWGLEIALRHVPPEDHSIVLAAQARAAATGVFAVEIRVLWPDGNIHWIASHGRVRYDSDGIPARMIGVSADITELKEAEAALRESQGKLRNVIDGLGPYMFVGLMTPDGVLIEANRPALEAAGLTPEDVLGQPFPETYWWAWSEAVQAQLLAAIARAVAGVPSRYDVQLRLVEGTLSWVDFSLFPVRDPGGAVIFLVPSAIIIDERKKAEAGVQQLNADLEQRVIERTAQLVAANKELEAFSTAVTRDLRVAEAADQIKSAFLATMSHELRTPLNSIIGFTGIVLLGKTGPLNPEQAKQLGMVRESARHLLALINDVLDLSKIEAGQMRVSAEPFDLPASIARVTAMVGPLAEKKGLVLAAVVAPELGDMVSDGRRVEQILLNLLSNAVKFTDRGHVSLTAERLADFQSSPEAAPCPAVHLQVADTGIGLKPESLAMLFQPFQQIDPGLARQAEGTGLGLAISRRLATLLGGEISAKSEWGQGSTFTVILPLHKPGDP